MLGVGRRRRSGAVNCCWLEQQVGRQDLQAAHVVVDCDSRAKANGQHGETGRRPGRRAPMPIARRRPEDATEVGDRASSGRRAAAGRGRSSRGNHRTTDANAPTRPMMANTAICRRPGNGADGQCRIADQRGGKPEGDGGHDEGKPLPSGGRRRAEGGSARIVQAVVDGHADQAGAEQQGGDVDLTEQQEGTGKGHGDADGQRQQIEQQRRQAAEDADDQQDGADDLDEGENASPHRSPCARHGRRRRSRRRRSIAHPASTS